MMKTSIAICIALTSATACKKKTADSGEGATASKPAADDKAAPNTDKAPSKHGEGSAGQSHKGGG